jgi:hypothetical protein
VFLKGKKRLPLLFIMLMFRLTLLGQSVLTPEHIEVSSTRVGNNLRVVFEDSRGFIWAGTMSDLVRYDGFSVKHYEYASDDRGGELDIIFNINCVFLQNFIRITLNIFAK